MREFARSILELNAVVLDTETTGLGDNAEICQIGILSLDGEVLLDSHVRPLNNVIWPEAEAVHGISPERVADAPLISELGEEMVSLLYKRSIIVYNADYDRRLLYQSIGFCESAKGLFNWLDNCQWVDVMQPYAQYWGSWSDYWQSYTWQSLVAACLQQRIEVENAHSAIGDCRMTLALLKKIADS